MEVELSHQEYTFDSISVNAGDHILVARSVTAMQSYFDAATVSLTTLLATSSNFSKW